MQVGKYTVNKKTTQIQIKASELEVGELFYFARSSYILVNVDFGVHKERMVQSTSSGYIRSFSEIALTDHGTVFVDRAEKLKVSDLRNGEMFVKVGENIPYMVCADKLVPMIDRKNISRESYLVDDRDILVELITIKDYTNED